MKSWWPPRSGVCSGSAHLLHKTGVDVVHQVVDLLQLLLVPVGEGELGICVSALHNRAGVDAVLPERVRNVEFSKYLQKSPSWALCKELNPDRLVLIPLLTMPLIWSPVHQPPSHRQW